MEQIESLLEFALEMVLFWTETFRPELGRARSFEKFNLYHAGTWIIGPATQNRTALSCRPSQLRQRRTTASDQLRDVFETACPSTGAATHNSLLGLCLRPLFGVGTHPVRSCLCKQPAFIGRAYRRKPMKDILLPRDAAVRWRDL